MIDACDNTIEAPWQFAAKVRSMTRWLDSPGGRRAVVAALALLAALLLQPDRAWAQDEPGAIVLEVTPEVVALPQAGQGARQALVVAHNRGAAEARELRLSWVSDAGVAIDIPAPTLPQLPAGAAHAWTLTLTRTTQSALTGTVLLRLDYTSPAGGQPISRLTLAPLRIDAPSVTPLAQVVNIQIHASAGGIDERHPRSIYLVLTNIASVPITVGPIAVDPIAPLPVAGVTPEIEPSTAITLAPRTTSAMLVWLRAGAVVQPGTYLVAFRVPVAWQEGGQAQQGTAVVTHEIAVGVVGESALLTALGIPSLFFLPGFLAVVTAGMVWRIGRAAEATFALRPPAPEFWVAAISLSFLISGGYRRIVGRDILDAYGLADILWLWTASIVVGAVGVYPAIGALRLFDRVRRGMIGWWIGRTQPSAQDTPLAVLEKLERQQLGTYLEQVGWTENGQPRTGYLLESWRSGQPTHWVGGEIQLTWQGAPADLQQQIRAAAEQGRPGELARLLRIGQRAGQLAVVWRSDVPPGRPMPVATAAITEHYGPQLILSGI
jgi:hypothetical protein